ncbi:calmodulin-regulated spectrin-associated protein 3 isoform X3 [Alligator mississippiensis]|uniref:calmodulin-regulated spectrin-associated protein 3 isoform X3 n=1 Tax=Alligator mississippiensis TaxID=8496 RepID=UPI00287765FA|nr:calmodulin-regulated spectrin-associated protein 3 isoform X3 [Alligator mississippiensis]
MRRALVPEIRPLDQYDSARARRAASLAWALATAHGGAGKVPLELQEPVYTDQYAQEHVKPPVTRLLLSAELLCRAWRQALPGTEAGGAPRDHTALLALLAQHGLAPALHGRPVTAADLHHAPLNMGAHLAVIDSLMVAFATEATSSLPTPPGMDMGPDAWEQKLLCWVDMVTRKLQDSTERESSQRPTPGTEGLAQPSTPGHKHAIAFCLKESGSKPPVIRYRKDKVLPTQAPCFPAITGLQDLASGAALAAMLHYYCPQLVRLEDVCLKEPMSVADSLYNLQLLQDFCARRLGGGCPLALEDLLYMPPALRVNIGAFLAELFLCFEVLKPDFVRPRDLGDLRDSPGLSDALTPNSCGSNSGSPVFSFRHPFFPGAAALSPLRGSPGPLHHSTSMSHVEGGFGKAWSRKQLSSHPLSQAVSFSIPFGLDSDVDIVMGNPVGLLRSASSDSLAPPRRAHSPAPASTPVTRTIHKLPLTPKVAAVAGGAAEPPLENGLTEALGELPTIEEALQIIHSAERLVPDGAPAGFYLHSPEPSKAPEPLPMASPRTRHGPPNGDDASSPSSGSSGGSGVRMTSFAERKKKLAAGAGQEAGPERVAELGPAGSAALSSEMSELGARLEEKRRAIEAQKKRIEAIFAKHRQRLGKSAFLQLRRHEAGDPVAQLPAPPPQGGDEQGAPPGLPRPRQVSFCPEPGGTKTEEELGDYNRAVAKLNTALTSLQLDMQRLSAQQERLLQDKRPSQAWVIPAPKGNRPPPTSAASSPPRRPPSAVVTAAPRSPQPVPRSRTAPAATPKSPKRARPVELKLPPLTRVLTPPQNVDTLPHLRKFSSNQVPVQTRSSIHFSEDEGESEVPEPPAQPQPESPDPGPRGGPRGAGGPRACGDGTSDASSPGEPRSSLVEVPLGSLHTGSDSDEDNGADSLEGSVAEGLEPEPRPSLGFYFKAEAEAAVEAEMAQKRANLLERQQRRSEEARQRRQWLEAEHEQRREEAPRLEVEEQSRAPAPVLEPEESAAGLASGGVVGAGGRRGAFTRQEHQRRQQLKLMEDLDKVLRPKAPGARPHRRGRPRTVCDDSALARSPPKGLLGARLSKVYSQSTLSLSTVANDHSNALGVKHPSRAASPVSPSRLLSTQSRERDWENASTASSPASVPEYTGPKLYKEPSAKSNKHIIHNALAHCCLAGRVNEPQKNRVLEEIEKSAATHFLILFRDGGCQFRALYAAGTEGEGLTRLAGCGPRAVAPTMIEGVYKYSSDRKRFTPIPSRSLSMSVDAFTIQGHFWQGRKPPTPKKPGTPK